jgi:hypothetical protein
MFFISPFNANSPSLSPGLWVSPKCFHSKDKDVSSQVLYRYRKTAARYSFAGETTKYDRESGDCPSHGQIYKISTKSSPPNSLETIGQLLFNFSKMIRREFLLRKILALAVFFCSTMIPVDRIPACASVPSHMASIGSPFEPLNSQLRHTSRIVATDASTVLLLANSALESRTLLDGTSDARARDRADADARVILNTDGSTTSRSVDSPGTFLTMLRH